MPNPIPDLMVPKFQSSGNVQVFKLLNGNTLDTVQDGADIVVTLEAPAVTDNNHANRMVEAFGERWLLHRNLIYRRSKTSTGWILTHTLTPWTVDFESHSGLHVVHVQGIPRLCVMWRNGGSGLGQVAYSLDGFAWTAIALSAFSAGAVVCMSITFRSSLLWLYRNRVKIYDFQLDTFTELLSPTPTGSNAGACAAVIDNKVLVSVNDTSNFKLYRIDGASLTGLRTDLVTNQLSGSTSAVIPVDSVQLDLSGITGTFSAGDTISDDVTGATGIIAAGPAGAAYYVDALTITGGVFGNNPCTGTSGTATITSVTNFRGCLWLFVNFNVSGVVAWFFPRPAIDGTSFDISAAVLPAAWTTIGQQANIVSYVALHPDPTDPGIYLWISTGALHAGSFDLWRFNNLTSLLTSLGSGIAASSFGLPFGIDGGVDRIPALITARPAWAGLPIEELGGVTRWKFRCEGTGSALSLQMLHDPDEGPPSTISSLVNGSIVVESGFLIGLEGYWKFNSDALDSSGIGRDLTLTGSVPFAAGLIGQAADFPGTNFNYYVRGADDPVLNFGLGLAAFTISVWVNADALPGGFATITEKGQGGANQGWYLRFNSAGDLIFAGYSGSAPSVTAPAAISAGAGWQHVVVTGNGALAVDLWVDGVLIDSDIGATGWINTFNPLRVGNGQDNNAPLDGQVDELALWSRKLNQTEIAWLYNTGSGFELENAPPVATTPTITDGQTIANVTPDGGSAVYSFQHDANADNISSGQGYTALLDIA
jgi:hypothetical protein